jgi:hypothetical protein
MHLFSYPIRNLHDQPFESETFSASHFSKEIIGGSREIFRAENARKHGKGIPYFYSYDRFLILHNIMARQQASNVFQTQLMDDGYALGDMYSPDKVAMAQAQWEIVS